MADKVDPRSALPDPLSNLADLSAHAFIAAPALPNLVDLSAHAYIPQSVAPAVKSKSAQPAALPEKIVRPFEAFRERKDQALERLRAVPGESFEAELCWGEAPSDYPGTPEADKNNKVTVKPVNDGFTGTVEEPEEPEEPKNPDQDLAWTEEWNNNRRDTEKIRVENPDDKEQYVMVERLKVLYMRAPAVEPFNGRRHKFTFKYAGAKKKTETTTA